MRSLAAPRAAVTLLSLEQALIALDPQLAQELAAARNDPHPFAMALFWDPLVVRADERMQKLLTELLHRVQSYAWGLIRLPNDPAQPAMPVTDDRQLAALGPESFDVAKSEVVLGGVRYRVRIATEPARITPPPPQGGTVTPAPQDIAETTSAAKPARARARKTDLQALYNARVTGEGVPTIEEDLLWATGQRISQRRVAALRANPDERLHTRGVRRRNSRA